MQEFLEQAFSRSSDAVHGALVDGARQALLTAYVHVCGHHPFSPALRRQQIIVGEEALRVCHAHQELMTSGGWAMRLCSGWMLGSSSITDRRRWRDIWRNHRLVVGGPNMFLGRIWLEISSTVTFNSRFDSGTGTGTGTLDG
jgi:hypothetical protein